MSHKNHRRGDVKKRFHLGQREDVSFQTISVNHRMTDGSKGICASSSLASENSRSVARDRRGAKKFVNSRRRFHENALAKRIIREIEND